MDISKYLSDCKLEASSVQPIYLQIADYLEQLMIRHDLPPNAKLPPERELAEILGVSRTTSINAYRQLERKGLVRTRIGSGTYVVEQIQTPLSRSMPWNQLYSPFPRTAQGDMLKELVSASYTSEHISLAAGMPDPAFYPLEVLNRLMVERLSATPPIDFGHIPTVGYRPLREKLAGMLEEKGIKAGETEIMITSGAQQGLYLLSKAFLNPGDYVIVENPTYIGAIQSFQAAGARILTVPTGESLNLELIEDYLIRYRPKLFYVIPTYQNPTGHLLRLEERQKLIQLAAKHRLVLVEDDAYGELYYGTKPPLSLKALDSYGGVIYLGTFSKALFPGLRTGWVVGDEEVIQRLAQEKQYVDLHSNNLAQWTLTQYLSADCLEEHLDKIRKEYKLRLDIAVHTIRRFAKDELEFSVPEGGFYLWCEIPKSLSSRILLYEAAKQGVSFVPGEAFYANLPQVSQVSQIRLCFSSQSPDRLVEGIKRLSIAVKNTAQSYSGKKSDRQAGIPII